MKFDKNYFVRQAFTAESLRALDASLSRELEIALSSDIPEVRFHFSYMALLKAGIYMAAREGYRVKSAPGHHTAIIEILSKIMDDKEIAVVGDRMRRDRNLDLYSFRVSISNTENEAYIKFIESVCKKVLSLKK